MDGEENISVFLVFFVALLAVVLVLAKCLHDRPILSSVLPEAAMVLAVGMGAGFIIRLIIGRRLLTPNEIDDDDDDDDDRVDKDVDIDLSALLSFNPQIFFIALLPPIIFNSGLRIGPLFFRHITPICLFALFGTTISAISTAFMLKGIVEMGWTPGFEPSLPELLTFGALISSTDPVSTLAVFQAKKVDPQLFYLVFGESVLNDALAIVLFDSLSRFVAQKSTADDIIQGFADFLLDLFLNSFGSLFLGGMSGLLTALLFKQIDMRQTRLLEISLYILLMYIPFLLAEILQLSGIVTILFTGISANRYVVPNLSAITKVNADMLFRLLAHLAETSIFLELGLSVFGLIGHWNWAFIGWSVLACLIARALNVYPIAFLFNRCLLRESDSSDEEEEIVADRILQFRRATSGKQPGDLTENFAPEEDRHADEGLFHNMKAKSFSEQSVLSVMTATPFHRKDLKIRSNTLHMLYFSGLRGAVAYACVRMFPEQSDYKDDFVMTTMAIVLITVFFFGGTTELALSALNVNVGVDEELYMRQTLREPVISSALTNFDNNCVRPFVIRDFKIMKHFHDNENEFHLSPGQRPHACVDPTIEITESCFLDATDPTFARLAKADSVFDYGAHR